MAYILATGFSKFSEANGGILPPGRLGPIPHRFFEFFIYESSSLPTL